MQRHLAASHSPPHTDKHSPSFWTCIRARLVSSLIRRCAWSSVTARDTVGLEREIRSAKRRFILAGIYRSLSCTFLREHVLRSRRRMLPWKCPPRDSQGAQLANVGTESLSERSTQCCLVIVVLLL